MTSSVEVLVLVYGVCCSSVEQEADAQVIVWQELVLVVFLPSLLDPRGFRAEVQKASFS